ncbi:MAG: hypothetical protein ACRD40_05235 [Candidatus Acidiferrales bacterium]
MSTHKLPLTAAPSPQIAIVPKPIPLNVNDTFLRAMLELPSADATKSRAH